MKKHIYFCLVIFFSAYNFAFGVNHKYFEDHFDDKNYDIASKITNYEFTPKFLADSKKSERILLVLQKNIGIKKAIIKTDVDKIISYAQYAAEILEESKIESIYVSKETSGLLFDLHIFSKDTMYIVPGQDDPKNMRGGYKKFCRGLDIKREELVAYLSIGFHSYDDQKKVLREIELMETFKTKINVLSPKNYDFYFVPENASIVKKFALITELFDFDLGEDPHFFYLSQGHKIEIMLSMAKSLKTVHEEKIVHRDLKLANFFAKVSTTGNYTVTLADFGLAERTVQRNFGQHLNGTKGYLDCQMCINHTRGIAAFNSPEEGFSSDVFSLGICFLKMIQPPILNIIYSINKGAFDSKDPSVAIKIVKEELENYQKVRRSMQNRTQFANLQNLVWEMMSEDLSKRPSIRSVIRNLEKIRDALNSPAVPIRETNYSTRPSAAKQHTGSVTLKKPFI